MKRTPLLFFCMLICALPALAQYPASVLLALEQTTGNRAGLKKALDHFYQSGDSLKIKSVNFLISWMPLHSSQSYYWSDTTGRRIAFDELKYGSFNEAVEAFNHLKTQYSGLHPVPFRYRDIDSLGADVIIENIELAVNQFRQQPHPAAVSESDFLEYVLPYRVSVEPLTNWRKKYRDTFSTAFDNNMADPLPQLKQTVNGRFTNLWGQGGTAEPLPRLSALQILLRRKGYCEDLADMVAFIARSHGIPAAIDNIPAWGTTSGNHFLNFLYLDKAHTHFDAVLDSLGREPGKVFRTTYSAQKDAIASWLDTTQIPPGFLQLKNYRDVTNEYWPADSISCALFPNTRTQVVYAAVLNGAVWRPVWYARKTGGRATFRNMGKGVVYLPMYYENNRLVPASWPVALGYRNKAVLRPDSLHPQTIVLKEQEKYLKFRAGKRYRLLIWNNQWQLLGEQTAAPECTQLVFNKVPANALLLLAPEYSEGKERPFMILPSGERVWW